MVMRMFSNSGQTYGKQIGTGVLTSLLWMFALIIWDHVDGNDFLFPWLKGWDLPYLLGAAFLATASTIILAVWVLSPSDIQTPGQRLF